MSLHAVPASVRRAAPARHNVELEAHEGVATFVFVHGFACDSFLWRHLTPKLREQHGTATLDLLGHGGSDRAAYDNARHDSLRGYAADLVTLLDELALPDVVLVGHSAGAMIGALAAIERPDLFGGLVMIGASARYLDDDGYSGGFTRGAVDGFFAAMDDDWLGFTSVLAPLAMGNPERPALAAELQTSYARARAEVAQQLARAIFLSDFRADLPLLTVPTVIVQSREDPMVTPAAAEFLHASIPGSEFVQLEASGHYPMLAAPDELAEVLRRF